MDILECHVQKQRCGRIMCLDDFLRSLLKGTGKFVRTWNVLHLTHRLGRRKTGQCVSYSVQSIK